MALPGNKNFSDYDNYITDQNPTTSAQAQDYFRNQAELLKAVIDCYFWQPETFYQPGDVVKSDSMPNGTEAVMVATNASVTSNVEPQWGAVGGANISDGTCFWHLRYRAVSVNNIEADNKGNITIPVMRASTNIASGADGLVPAPPATSNELFLSNDGEWKEAGKVKSVNGETGDVVVDVPVQSVNGMIGEVEIKESPSDMTDYIVESYRNGTEWYEVYKSGKVRQGGKVSLSTYEKKTITLTKAMADTNYIIYGVDMSGVYQGSPEYMNTLAIKPQSSTQIYINHGNYSVPYSWVVEGQGA